MNIIQKILGSANDRLVKSYDKTVSIINDLEATVVRQPNKSSCFRTGRFLFYLNPVKSTLYTTSIGTCLSKKAAI